tara:strand:- start:89 stop:523 length:435 start_codon:yes stop_codon:yes gene_type:complete
MEKDQNINSENQDTEMQDTEIKEPISENQNKMSEKSSNEKSEELKEIAPEDKIKELEDKVSRAFAEMENQRRRFEKERNDAFDYGGFAFAKETLNLIDNFERSKQILENDEILKNTEALKKTLEHLILLIKIWFLFYQKMGLLP